MKQATFLAAVLATALSLPLAAQQTQPNSGQPNSGTTTNSGGQTGTSGTTGSPTYQQGGTEIRPQPGTVGSGTRRGTRNRSGSNRDATLGTGTTNGTTGGSTPNRPDTRRTRETRNPGGNTGTSPTTGSATGSGTTNPPR